MSQIISGRILSIDEEDRIIIIEGRKDIKYCYIQRSLMNKIGKYLSLFRFVQFVVSEERRVYKGKKIYTIDYFRKIMEIRYRKNIVFYDIKNIKKGTKQLINSLGVKMFLDLEMAMHPYKQDKNFTQEIIQVGYVLVDKRDNIIKTYNQMIKPTLHPHISKRTIKFLGISQDEVDQGISYKEFYSDFRNVILTHKPAIIVWGRNDFLALRQSYRINKVPSLQGITRYINLLKLHKNFYHLRNDLGLFKALGLYQEVENNQIHNAYEDAIATFEIFKGFRRVLNGKQKVDTTDFQ